MKIQPSPLSLKKYFTKLETLINLHVFTFKFYCQIIYKFREKKSKIMKKKHTNHSQLVEQLLITCKV